LTVVYRRLLFLYSIAFATLSQNTQRARVRMSDGVKPSSGIKPTHKFWALANEAPRAKAGCCNNHHRDQFQLA
jgi:hypothetical protein